MTARVKLIHLINDHIASHRNGIDDEVIATVVSRVCSLIGLGYRPCYSLKISITLLLHP